MGGQAASIPTWIAILQGLAVPVLGAAAALIAFMQWRTADRKVQLDLFDRRFALYTDAREMVSQILREGGADFDNAMDFRRKTDRAPFLFGDEIVDAFRDNADHIARLAHATEKGRVANSDAIWGDRKEEQMDNLSRFYQVMPDLLEPYMKLDHKIWRRPRWARLRRRA